MQNSLTPFLFFIFFILSSITYSQEICNNGIDDDGDGLIDLNDINDCVCTNLGGGSTAVQSIIPNASFEDMDCCPDNISQLNCASTWIQASWPTSDYFNTCDYSPPWLGTIPDGNAAVGAFFADGWQEYIGACITQPIVAGEEYLLQVDVMSVFVDGGVNYTGPNTAGPVDITLFGTPNCADLPFPSNGCPIGTAAGWEVIGTYTYDPSSTWESIIIPVLSTVDINAVALGSPCNLPSSYVSSFEAFVAFDNLVLNEAYLFASTIDGDFYNQDNDTWVSNGSYTDSNGDVHNVGSICADEVEFTAHVDTIGDYQWYYEGVAISGETDTIMTLSNFQTGEYQFMLDITTSGECVVSTYLVDPPESPVALFTNSLSSLCSPSNITLTDASTFSGDLLSWEWSIDNTIVGAGSNMSSSITSPGIHNIDLLVLADNFCEDSFSTTINLANQPVAAFNVNNACIGEQTNFADISSTNPGSNINSWSWDFGDGNTSNIQNPSNVFNSNQNYNISLSITDDNQCVSNITTMISAYATPQVSFQNIPTCLGYASSFLNTSMISSGTIDSWAWTFGDNNISTDMHPSHTYTASNDFPITLTGTSNNGCEGSTTGNQIVSFATADFSSSASPNCSPLCVDFASLSSSNYGNLTSLTWTFESNPVEHDSLVDLCFKNNSNLDILFEDVELSIVNSYGCVDTMLVIDALEIWPNPLADFESEFYSTSILTPIFNFTNTSVGAISYEWDNGLGILSTDVNLNYEYPEALVYQVELTATNQYSCTDIAVKPIELLPSTNIFVPSSFSPQEDGVNDVFRPVVNGDDIIKYKLDIYNRLGEKVFVSTDPNEAWNGTEANSSDYYMNIELYNWVLEVKFRRNSDVFVEKGTVTVIR